MTEKKLVMDLTESRHWGGGYREREREVERDVEQIVF